MSRVETVLGESWRVQVVRVADRIVTHESMFETSASAEDYYGTLHLPSATKRLQFRRAGTQRFKTVKDEVMRGVSLAQVVARQLHALADEDKAIADEADKYTLTRINPVEQMAGPFVNTDYAHAFSIEVKDHAKLDRTFLVIVLEAT